MLLKKYILGLLCVLFGAQSMMAQIAAPDFKCVQKDTLKWATPVNTCGPFNAYLIYVSLNRNGPYSLYTKITNPAQTKFYKKPVLDTTFYYFMQSDFACPDNRLSSDTLDNKLPPITEIKSVSVENGKALITWNKASKNETYDYVIYKKIGSGVSPIDTVIGKLSYIDLKSVPSKQQETYYVLAADRCNNTSLFGSSHTSIMLSGTQDACKRTSLLTWNRYRSWKEGIEKHYVYVKIGAGPIALVDSVKAADTTYLYKNLTNGEKYTIYIRSIKKGNPQIVANTSEYTFTAAVLRNVKNLFLKNVSVTADNKVEVTWLWNTDAELVSHNILRSNAQNAYANVASNTTKTPLIQENIYVDASANPSAQKLYYKIKTFDKCKDSVASNYAATVFIAGKPNPDFTNSLTWTKFDAQTAGASYYDLYKIVGTDEKLIGSYLKDTTFVDKVDGNNPEEAKSCYYVVASAILALPAGASTSVKSRSNIACVNQTPGIAVPNAFVPYGRNQEFKPLISFSEGLDYKMTIYDRYGSVVFTTTTIAEGWNGQLGGQGRDMPQGVYTYYIKAKRTDGLELERKGTLTLIR